MSIEALNWAFAQTIDKSSVKFVLVAMANIADDEMICWPSISYLSDATGQDRKTVVKNMKWLREAGWIEATGAKKGNTHRVVVYRLNSTKTGPVSAAEIGPKTDINGSENGIVSQGVIGPFFRGNRSVFPSKQVRFSAEIGPKTDPGTTNEPPMNHHGTTNAREPPDLLPDWLPQKAWEDFCQHRGKKFGALAQRLTIKKLGEFRNAGMDPAEVLNQSVMNGWRGVFELKGGRKMDQASVTEQARRLIFAGAV